MWWFINSFEKDYLIIFSQTNLSGGWKMWVCVYSLTHFFTFPLERKINDRKSKLCLHYTVWHKPWITSERCASVQTVFSPSRRVSVKTLIQPVCRFFSAEVFDLAPSQTVQQARSKPKLKLIQFAVLRTVVSCVITAETRLPQHNYRYDLLLKPSNYISSRSLEAELNWNKNADVLRHRQRCFGGD